MLIDEDAQTPVSSTTDPARVAALDSQFSTLSASKPGDEMPEYCKMVGDKVSYTCNTQCQYCM